MDFGKILDFFNQPRLVFGVALSTGIILFMPPQILQSLGFVGFLDSFRAYVGIAFIITTVYSLIHTSSLGLSWLTNKKKKRETARTQQEYLAKLTKPEQEILYYFISRSTETQRLDIHSGVVNGLVNKGIIFPASSRATAGYMTTFYGPVYTCDHNMVSWAWDYLNEHKELLDEGSEPDKE